MQMNCPNLIEKTADVCYNDGMYDAVQTAKYKRIRKYDEKNLL